MIRIVLTVAALAVAGVLVGCGGGGEKKSVTHTDPGSGAPSCPQAWRAGWQRLASQVRTTVYCPSWMPQPLDAKIGGSWANGRYVAPDRSYFVSFIWMEPEPSQSGVQEVHVNFRGYPGRTRIPTCEDTLTVAGKTVHPKLPCFSDARWKKRFGNIVVTAYTANQGADQWHILYAWRQGGSLYAISEHVAPPFTYRGVVANLDRMMRGLVPVQPSG